MTASVYVSLKKTHFLKHSFHTNKEEELTFP